MGQHTWFEGRELWEGGGPQLSQPSVAHSLDGNCRIDYRPRALSQAREVYKTMGQS